MTQRLASGDLSKGITET